MSYHESQVWLHTVYLPLQKLKQNSLDPTRFLHWRVHGGRARPGGPLGLGSLCIINVQYNTVLFCAVYNSAHSTRIASLQNLFWARKSARKNICLQKFAQMNELKGQLSKLKIFCNPVLSMMPTVFFTAKFFPDVNSTVFKGTRCGTVAKRHWTASRFKLIRGANGRLIGKRPVHVIYDTPGSFGGAHRNWCTI